MHELGIAQGILAIARSSAEHAGATRVLSVTVAVGEMREVVPSALDFAWEALTDEDPLMAGSALEVVTIPPRSRCLTCGAEFEHSRMHLRCPECGGTDLKLLGGRELDVTSIDVDLDDTCDDSQDEKS